MIGVIDVGILFAAELRAIIASNPGLIVKRRGSRQSSEIGIVPAIRRRVEFFEAVVGRGNSGVGILFAAELRAVKANWNYYPVGGGRW